MTVVTLTPTGTHSSSGIAVTGAANAHAALSDSSDSSYVTLDAITDSLSLDMSDLTLPAGAVITQVALVLRTKYTSFGYRLGADLFDLYDDQEVNIGWTTFATHVPIVYVPPSLSEGGASLDTEIDGETVSIHSTTGGGGSAQVANATAQVIYVVKPVVTVTAPSGAISDTNTPTVRWTDTFDADGGGQNKYEVKIFSAAQYGAGGFDPATSTPTETSGVRFGANTSWAPSDPLPDATYRAYVRGAQQVLGSDFWSDWDYEPFTITANAPGVPSIHVVAEDDDGRIWITLDDTLGSMTHKFEVQRSIDNGTTWEAIRTLAGGQITPSGGIGRAYDTEVGNGVTVIYRARAANIITEFTTYSAWSASTTPTAWQSASWWLKSPSYPDLNIPVGMAGMDPLEQDANQGVFTALGRRLPIVVSDVRGGWHGAVSFTFADQAARDDFDALLDTNEPLLLQAPPANYWEDRYVMLGALTRARGVDKAFVEWTIEKVAWTEIDAPTGDVLEWPAFGS